MRRSLLLGGVFVTAILNVLTAGAGPASTPPTTRELLREIAQTTDADWAAIARGEAVAKVRSGTFLRRRRQASNKHRY